ncbi:phosphatase PAP2 family protein [uncultured Shewanella sp.]|uniref:phosphatase PAP2 family protein n=1 Tax=Shewanella atlantica TaxID=271099 RepID=UPI0026192BF6|nr:phosphatase PAP2 family protein [uncultured Shewanella sp.]
MFIAASALAISDIDKRAFRYLLLISHRHGCIPLAKRVSFTGDGPLYLLVALVLLVSHVQGEAFFKITLAAFIVELPLYFLLKNTIRRPRPCHTTSGYGHGTTAQQGLNAEGKRPPAIDFEPSDRFSLPSGHTAAAFVMASTISQLYPQWMFAAYLWAIAIGLSRVVLAVHYPLDIIAGAILGIVSVYFAELLLTI